MFNITILGCGPSSGVPGINGYWGDCNPDNQKNLRTRSAIFVQHNNTSILIDCGPDIKQQILREKIKDFDMILLTHEHYDHVAGLSDLRGLFFESRKMIPVYSDKKTLDYVTNMHEFVFESKKYDYLNNYKIYNPETNSLYKPDVFKPYLKPVEIVDVLTINNFIITAFNQLHGPIEFNSYSLGFRFDTKDSNNNNISWAYSNDVLELDDNAFDKLKNLDLWIVDCTCIHPKLTHAHLDKTLSWIDKIQPKRSLLTNMAFKMDYDYMKQTLPINVEPAFDGMQISL